MHRPRALIIDDEPDIRELLEITLGRMDIETMAADDLTAARKLMSKNDFDLCLTDMRLPDGDGIDLVKEISKVYPQLPVAVITAHGNVESATQALKAGAFDFVSKPVDLKILRKLVTTALKLRNYPATTATDSPAAKGNETPQLLGKSSAIEATRQMIAKLARSQAPVYISGESGTGKELAARLIHQQGLRADQPFVPVNCGAIPRELMESEFFGHKKGSFTGAIADKDGLFQAADGGILFLDEVADLPLDMQVKLLRAIQEKSIRPVGGQQELTVDVRIISATHKDLAMLVERGEFRQDLFYRINVIELNIPPLRERREDIPVLVDNILNRLATANGKPKPRLDRDALEKLYKHPLLGNVRELENILERAITMCENDRIGVDELLLPAPSQEDMPLDAELPLEQYLEQIERQKIEQALEETRWNRTAAAKKLGLSFRALRYRLNKLGID